MNRSTPRKAPPSTPPSRRSEREMKAQAPVKQQEGAVVERNRRHAPAAAATTPTSSKSFKRVNSHGHGHAATPVPTPRSRSLFPVDPLQLKRQEQRHQAHAHYLKSSAESNRAKMKFLAMDADLQVAVSWQQVVAKNLEDVGRRIERQDWMFRKLEEDGGVEDVLRSDDEEEKQDLAGVEEKQATEAPQVQVPSA